MYLIFRFGMVLLFCLIKNYFIFALFASFVSFTSAVVVAVIQPYKRAINIKIDIILLSGMGVLYFGFYLIAIAKHDIVMSGVHVIKDIMLGVGTGIPMLYTLTLIMYYCFKNWSGHLKKLLQRLHRRHTTSPLLPRQ